jgi:hypothetical protein
MITVLHLGILLGVAAPQGTFSERYHALVAHDSEWFLNIIGRGYQSPIPPSPQKRMEVSNVAFFPGFPLWGAAVINAFDLHPRTGLTLASHLATWGFWTYLLLFARRIGLRRGMTAAAVGLILAHPAAFYLIAAYSESLFLLMLVGFMFWNLHGGRMGFVLACVHGIGMTGTRIAGAPAAAFPIVQAWFARRAKSSAQYAPSERSRLNQPPPRLLLRAAIVMTISLAGMIAFFVYTHVRFQHWDFYMMTQQAGWGVKADYLALLKPGAYQRWLPSWQYASLTGQALVPFTMLLCLAAAIWEIRAARAKPTRWRERIGLYFVGFGLFYIAVAGVYSVRLESMTRYHFGAHVFFVLAGLHAFVDLRPRGHVARGVLVAIALLALAGACLHFTYASQFMRGGWVA